MAHTQDAGACGAGMYCGLAGVQFGLFAGPDDTVPLLTCTSDADGDCSFADAFVGTPSRMAVCTPSG